MAKSATIPGKRRTREHVIADLSVNFVERQAFLCGYSVERWVHDYGIDLVLSTYTDEGETESGRIFFQVKATDHLTTVQKGRFISFRIERVDLRAWLAEPLPVILIVYDALNERAYWLYIHDAFAGVLRFQAARGSERLTIRIPISQVLDPTAIRLFREFRDAVLDQIRGVIHQDE